MGKHFKNIIFTDHAIERMQLRRLDPVTLHELWHAPEHIESLAEGKEKRIATKHDRTVHMIGTYLADEDRWLLISTWVRGEDDPLPVVWQVLAGLVRMGWRLLRFVLQMLIKLIRFIGRKFSSQIARIRDAR